MSDLTITIIDDAQSRKPSLFRQFAVIAFFVAILFGPGLLANSAAMQWAGFIVCLILVSAAMKIRAGDRMTLHEARRKLEELEAKGRAEAAFNPPKPTRQEGMR
ncbi:hypothetical protein PUV47_01265 [Pseudovibrio exalbescens]|uniref:hypothetical protein n=1 Tax=Pseudovibrio exalbescens TaxID=197461 RepID=UPI00236594F9|nr:hypothetical protein [Pseudovibrio exalbescens]MDD7908530.1 hypothetical protein [Pseudovibrio exalbescens]